MKISHYRPNLFDTMWADVFNTDVANRLNVFNPKVDIHSTDNNIAVNVELPGLTSKDIKIEIKDGVLVISGTKQEEETKADEVFRTECCYGEFKRSFQLGDLVDDKNISAKQENGILKITIAKLKEAAPREIKVQSDYNKEKGKKAS